MLSVRDILRFYLKNVGFSILSYRSISLLKIGIFGYGIWNAARTRTPQNVSYKLVPSVLSWNPENEVVCPTFYLNETNTFYC